MPTVGRLSLNYVVQDNRGFKARMSIIALDGDVLGGTGTMGDFATSVAAVGTALQAMTNAKIVSTGYSLEFDIAQEPTSETGTYRLVEQGAHLTFGDGGILKEHLTIPAPIDGLFLTTTQDNLVVVNPAASTLVALQAATAGLASLADGQVFAQFFGGQLRSQKPRRRRVLQGA